MSIFQALVLGIVQGATEFIPVSSSAHIVLTPFFFGWDQPSLAFVVAAHIGTLVAVIAVFKDEVARLVRTAYGWGRADDADKRILKLIVIATIPAVVIGAAFKSSIGDSFERPVLVSLFLAVTAYLLFSSETIYEHREVDPELGQQPPRDLGAMETKDAVAIGIAQAAAILPGISRSGATISFAMRRGIARRPAAAFSFLLSIPTIAGAAIFEIPDMLKESSGASGGAFAVGIIASGVMGFVSVRWFLRVIQRIGLRPFGIYCVLLMIAGLLTALARG